jgi:hypothetical protein
MPSFNLRGVVDLMSGSIDGESFAPAIRERIAES